MRLRSILISVMIGISVCLFACSAALEQVSSLEISFDDFQITKNITKELEVRVGDTFTVSLFSNPTTGFKWPDLGKIADETILKQVDHEYEAPDSDIPGAGGKEHWTFEALKEGKTTISMEYNQPWEGGIKAEWTFGLTVSVK